MTVAGASELATVGAIVIGGDEEGRVRVDWLTVKGQIFNALRFWVNALAFAVVARWLSDIHLIIHAVYNVEVIGAEAIPVNQPLRFSAVRINLIKLPGGTFQPA